MAQTFAVPDTISLAKVQAILADLGIETDPRHIREVVIGIDGVHVELIALSDDGQPYMTPDGRDIATHRISMRLDQAA